MKTYIKKNNKPGEYFLNIEGGKTFSVLVTKILSGLPYEKSSIRRTLKEYVSANKLKVFKLDTEFIVGKNLLIKPSLTNS